MLQVGLKNKCFLPLHVKVTLTGRDIFESYVINSQLDLPIPGPQGSSGELANQQADGP